MWSVYNKYSAVELKLFPETKIKPFEYYRNAAQFKGASKYGMNNKIKNIEIVTYLWLFP